MPATYIVHGKTDEYSDRCEWLVAAYSTKEQAEAHCKLAQEWVDKLDYYDYENPLKAEHNPYDPGCSLDYTGTQYTVIELPEVRHPDEYLEWLQDNPPKRS